MEAAAAAHSLTSLPPLTELFSLQLQILGAISLQMFFFSLLTRCFIFHVMDIPTVSHRGL